VYRLWVEVNVGVKNAAAAPGAAAGAPAAPGPGGTRGGGGGGCRTTIWQDQVRYQVSQQGLVWLGLALVCRARFIFVFMH
jgi:hypothetical protein